MFQLYSLVLTDICRSFLRVSKVTKKIKTRSKATPSENFNSHPLYLVMKTERRRPYHYTRVQHLQPEDYPARREFCTWLLNLEENNPNFVLQILFSDESIFGRRGC
jgi:hypothetical protein